MHGYLVDLNTDLCFEDEIEKRFGENGTRSFIALVELLTRGVTVDDLLGRVCSAAFCEEQRQDAPVDYNGVAFVLLCVAMKKLYEIQDEQPMRNRLERLFWDLPSRHKWWDWKRPIVLDVKHLIFRELISEWELTTNEPNASSMHAFRRIIAMGWAQHQATIPLPGESEVELNARGRFVHKKEHEYYTSSIREYLQKCGERSQAEDADAIFTPWLTQPSVPDDILKLLVMARAKLGGPALALRDIENAKRSPV